MKKSKSFICFSVAVLCFAVLSVILIISWQGGAFNKLTVTDITSYESPDGSYCLIYQQLGDPEWPFGKTEVRFTLNDCNNNTLNTVDTYIQNDGALAHKGNIKSIEWTENSVIVILQASEMSDKEIVIGYNE